MIVNFPDKVWGRLASIADNRGVSIADLIYEATQTVLAGPKPVERVTRRRQAHVGTFDPSDPDVIAKVRELYALNRDRQEIATEFGVSYQAIRTLCNRLGLAARRHVQPRKVDDDWFLDLYEKGWTDQQIATRLGVADVTIGRVRRRLGLPTVTSKTYLKEGNHA